MHGQRKFSALTHHFASVGRGVHLFLKLRNQDFAGALPTTKQTIEADVQHDLLACSCGGMRSGFVQASVFSESSRSN